MAAEKSPFSDQPAHPKYLHEDEELSQQCKDLIATLSTESGWINVQLHQYNGFWFAKRHLQGILNCQNHFQAQDSDILLVTTPKSGTTWLKALAFAILNRNNHYHSHPLLTTNPHDLVPFLDMNLYYQKAMPSRGTRSETRGSISIEDSFDKFCRGVIDFCPFWEHMLGYYKESLERPDKIMFLRFEELKDEPVKILKRLAEFIGSGFSKDEENGKVVENMLKLCSFETLSNLEVNRSGKTQFGAVNSTFFRNGEVGDWKNFLTLDMIKRLDDISQEKLGKYGLKF
ncbi:hypothetical protein K1719_022806 [Acacia pycnantha]|nr:hypothetical protein K1719_022806 [Acacia pycnantha]